MATLQISVLDDLGIPERIFTYAGTSGDGSTISGNIPKKVRRTGEGAYDLNNPNIAGSISVSSYSQVRFSSGDLSGQAAMVGQMADHVESGYIQIIDEDAAIAGQTGGAAVMAAESGGLITVTGLTGMTTASVGRKLTISGAVDPDNNGTFLIAAHNSATSVDIIAGAAPGGEGSLTWTELGVVMDRTALEAYL